MHLMIYAVGRLASQDPCQLLVESWKKKITRWKIDTIITETKGHWPLEKQLQNELDFFSPLLEHVSRVFLFDREGISPSSEAFADQLRDQEEKKHQKIYFILGGSHGVHHSIREKIKNKISFGAMTWPHALARAMVFEQLYRAQTILAGHPYHK
jgi:23S rRNA (pseudouridine1915-N3)-methyltransferase